MGTITVSITQASRPDLSRTFTIPDAHLDRAQAALQQDANTAVNGTATRGQVWNTWIKKVIDDLTGSVRAHERQVAVAAVPEPAPITPN